MSNQSAKLTLTIDWPEITLERLSRLTSLWSDVVHEVGTDITGKRGALKLVLADISFSSPLQVHATPTLLRRRADPSTLATLSHAVVSGVRDLEKHADRPGHFSTRALELTRKLALFSNPERRLLVSNGTGDDTAITTRTIAAVDGILGPAVESYGSVEGQLEGIFTHGRRLFYVYDALNGRQVRCFFGKSTQISDLLQYFGRRVIVSGLVRSKPLTGQPTNIRVSKITVFRDDDALLPMSEILSQWEHDR